MIILMETVFIATGIKVFVAVKLDCFIRIYHLYTIIIANYGDCMFYSLFYSVEYIDLWYLTLPQWYFYS